MILAFPLIVNYIPVQTGSLHQNPYSNGPGFRAASASASVATLPPTHSSSSVPSSVDRGCLSYPPLLSFTCVGSDYTPKNYKTEYNHQTPSLSERTPRRCSVIGGCRGRSGVEEEEEVGGPAIPVRSRRHGRRPSRRLLPPMRLVVVAREHDANQPRLLQPVRVPVAARHA